MRFPIRIKLLTAFGFILVLAVGMVLFAYTLTDQYIRAQRIAILQDKAQSLSDSLQDYFSNLQHEYTNLAIEYRNSKGTEDSDFETLAMHQVTTHQATTELTVLNRMGREIVKYTENGRAKDEDLSLQLQSQAFDKAKGGEISLSKTYFEGSSPFPQIDMYVPVTDTKANVTAVIKGRITLQNLQEVLGRLNLGRDGFGYIVDMEGQLIAHPRYRDLANSNTVSQRPVIKKLVSEGYSSLKPRDHYYTNEKGVAVIASSNLVSSLGWVTAVEQPESEAFAQLMFIRNILIGLLLVTLIVLLVVAAVISNQLAYPISLLQKRTQDLQQGRPVAQLDLHTGDELEGLTHSFNLMAHDLQERERNLQDTNLRLQQERDRQETLLQSLTDGVAAVDANNQIILFNRAAEAVTGIRSDQAIGQPIDKIIVLTDDQAHRVKLSDYSNQDDEYKLRLRQHGLSLKKGDSSLPVSLAAAQVKGEHDEHLGWVVSFRDMTKEHEFEVMKLDFVSMAAHELRTPLTALRGYLSILLDEGRESLPEASKTFLDRSLISANQLSSLVENLLNVSRIERGALKVELAPIQLSNVITDALTNLIEVARQKKITVTFEQPSEPMPLVMADQFRISEVITNLVANGINYTKTGGWVKVTMETQGDTVVTSVHDNGEGIPADSLPHLFTKFYRVQASLAQGSKGTGLGLFISKAIVMAHGGRIWAESVEDKGSTFSFALPQAPTQAKAGKKSST